ncbi:MAG: hypothetical protein IJS81_07575 [Selenomonadaceae bacterium]|nr:hypothetical protein [Selenomonadaceae bacterium]
MIAESPDFSRGEYVKSVFEIEAALKIFQDAIPEDAEIIWDVMSDDSLVDKVKVIIIAEKSIA